MDYPGSERAKFFCLAIRVRLRGKRLRTLSVQIAQLLREGSQVGIQPDALGLAYAERRHVKTSRVRASMPISRGRADHRRWEGGSWLGEARRETGRQALHALALLDRHDRGGVAFVLDQRIGARMLHDKLAAALLRAAVDGQHAFA